MKKIVFLVIINYLLLIAVCYSQISTWTHTFGGPRDDNGYSVFQTRDGGFFMVGERSVQYNQTFYISQSYLVKLDYWGNVQWQLIYGDSTIENYAYSAAEDLSGNIYVPYITDRANLMKLDRFGNILWNKNYPDTIYGFGSIVISKNHENLILSGYNYTPALFDYTVSLTKCDTSGNIVWSRSYYDTISYGAQYNDLLVTENSYYICGRKGYNQYSFVGWILKIDTTGNVLWRIFQAQGNMGFFSIAQNSPSTFIASGRKIVNQGFGATYIKFDSNGFIKWQKDYYIDTVVGSDCILRVNDNRFVSVSSCMYDRINFPILDSSGNITEIIHHNYEMNNLICYNNVNNTDDSCLLITGQFTVTNANYRDCLIIKTDKLLKAPPVGIKNTGDEQVINDFEINVFPNPFNSELRIRLFLNKTSNVFLTLYDILGRQIFQFYYKDINTGTHIFKINPDLYNLASGIYFLRIDNGALFKTKKIVFLK